MDPEMSIAKQVYQTRVLAERTIEVQKLIQSNTDSMSVQLKATENMKKNSKPANTNLTKSEIVTKGDKKARKKDSEKVGSLKLKISFMRRKEFEDHQLSKVLRTESEVKRQMQMPGPLSSPISKKKKKQNFTVRHMSASAPHKTEQEPNFADDENDVQDIEGTQIAIGEKEATNTKRRPQSKTYERKREADSDDSEQQSGNGEFGL